MRLFEPGTERPLPQHAYSNNTLIKRLVRSGMDAGLPVPETFATRFGQPDGKPPIMLNQWLIALGGGNFENDMSGWANKRREAHTLIGNLHEWAEATLNEHAPNLEAQRGQFRHTVERARKFSAAKSALAEHMGQILDKQVLARIYKEPEKAQRALDAALDGGPEEYTERYKQVAAALREAPEQVGEMRGRKLGGLERRNVKLALEGTLLPHLDGAAAAQTELRMVSKMSEGSIPLSIPVLNFANTVEDLRKAVTEPRYARLAEDISAHEKFERLCREQPFDALEMAKEKASADKSAEQVWPRLQKIAEDRIRINPELKAAAKEAGIEIPERPYLTSLNTPRDTPPPGPGATRPR